MTLVVERQGQLRKAIVDAPFDWLVIAQPENVAYATGYRSVGWDVFRGHLIVAVVGADDLWLAGPCADAGPALHAGVVPDDRYAAFGRFFFESANGSAVAAHLADQHEDLAAAVATVLDRLPPRSRVGVDRDVGGRLRAMVEEHGHVAEVVDAADWMLGVRARKLAPEIERLARAATLAEESIECALLAAAPGVSEQDLAAVVAATMAAGGGSPRFVVVTGGERSALADARPSERRLLRGDLLRFDVGCIVDGYWSDLGRTAVLGEPDRKQRERYDAILAGEAAQLDAVRAGIKAGDLFDVAVRAVEEAGLAPYRRHHCGHAIGMEVYERPVVSPGVEATLSAGMVLCVETPYYELGWGGMMVEDMLVVTDDGCELLSHGSRELRVLDA